MLSSLAEGSNLPLPTADKAGLSRDRKGAAHWPSAGAICHSRAIGNPVRLSPGGRGRPGRRQRRRPGRLRGPLCHPCASRSRCPSCASSSPVRLSPPRERPAVPKAPPGEGATVSFVHKQEPSPPLPLRERVASRPGWPGEGATVSFLRKRQSRLLCTHPPCHPCVSRNAVRLSPCGRGWPAVQAGRVRGSPCPSCASRNPAGVIPAQAAVQKEITGFPLSRE